MNFLWKIANLQIYSWDMKFFFSYNMKFIFIHSISGENRNSSVKNLQTYIFTEEYSLPFFLWNRIYYRVVSEQILYSANKCSSIFFTRKHLDHVLAENFLQEIHRDTFRRSILVCSFGNNQNKIDLPERKWFDRIYTFSSYHYILKFCDIKARVVLLWTRL